MIFPNGEWRYDELTGFSLIERKWAYGFAGGSSGSLSWDWAREIYFGIERSDGSAKIWEGLMREMGEFIIAINASKQLSMEGVVFSGDGIYGLLVDKILVNGELDPLQW